MPTFSIIIPVYRVEKYIKQCVESIINQTYKDFEALFVDDCGGDKSINIVEKYAKKDKRIKILYHEKNRGVAAARNTALDASIGKYIVCVDSDDWLEPNALECIYNAFKEFKTNSVWFDANRYHDEKGLFAEKSVLECKEGYLKIVPNKIADYSDYNWAKAYTAESIKKYNLRWPEGLYFEDGEFYFEYFSLNPITYITENRIYNYRFREESITFEYHKNEKKLKDLFQIIKNIRQFYIDNNMYSEYKIAILKLIETRINICIWDENNYEFKLKMLKDLFDEFDFPNDFEEFNHKTSPLVSVIVPVYNVEEYLEKCLKSILQQTYKNIEIVLVDDCSTDNSLSIMKRYQKNDKRIKIFSNKVNKGVSVTRNTGIDKSSGEYIFFIDPDDWVSPNLVDTVMSKFKETNLPTIWFKPNQWFENEQVLTPFWNKYLVKQPEGYLSIDNTNFFIYSQYPWKVAYKSSIIKENDIKFPEGIIYEDMLFYTKIYTKYPETYMIDKILYTYRIRENSLVDSSRKFADRANDMYVATKMIYDYLCENDLFDKYYDAYINFVNSRINTFAEFPDVHKKIAPKLKRFLKKITLEKDSCAK